MTDLFSMLSREDSMRRDRQIARDTRLWFREGMPPYQLWANEAYVDVTPEQLERLVKVGAVQRA